MVNRAAAIMAALTALLTGFLASFIGSIAAGPVGVLVAARGLANRTGVGMALAAGAAVAEAAWAYAAYLTAGALIHAVPTMPLHLRIATPATMLIVGGYLMVTRPDARPRSTPDRGHAVNVFAGLVLSALNPAFLATWTTVAAVGLSTGLMTLGRASAAWFSLGVAAGALAWAWVLLHLVGRYRQRFEDVAPTRVRKFLGGILAVAGLLSALRVVLE